MAKDYARRPATKKGGGTAQTPGWVWMLMGLLLGVIVTGLVFMRNDPQVAKVVDSLPKVQIETSPPTSAAAPGPKAIERTPPPAPKPAPAPQPAPKPEEAKPAPKPEENKMAYDFYTVLPEQEVAVVEGGSGSPKEEKPKELPAGKYVLQVGSFQTRKEAEEQKARLALTLGETASVQSVEVSGATWHRVRLGPYTDTKALDRVRDKLKESNVKYVVLKEKS